MNWKTIIIEDEQLARQRLKRLLGNYQEVEIIAEAENGSEGLELINQHEPDLIFLDIEMPVLNGFEMLAKLGEHQPKVVFTTAYDQYAIKAFDEGSIDYLLKPIEKIRFEQAMQKLPAKLAKEENSSSELLETASLSPAQNSRIVVKSAGVIKIIPVSELHYIEADDDYVKLSTSEGNFHKNKTMGFFEQTLDPSQFIRIHRSYIINLAQVTKIELKEKDSYIVLLKSDIWLPVSKTGYVKLKAALGL